MSKPLLRLSLALSVASVPATAQDSSEYEWKFGTSGMVCYARVSSHFGNARLEVSYVADGLLFLIVARSHHIGSLAVNQTVIGRGVFSDGTEVDLGELLVLTHDLTLSDDDQRPWTALVISDGKRLQDERMLSNDTLTVYLDSEYLGAFPLFKAREAFKGLLDCHNEYQETK